MKKFGKLALLLVVFGWFCPVACKHSGLEWMQATVEGEAGGFLAIFAIMLALSMIAALVGLIFFAVFQ